MIEHQRWIWTATLGVLVAGLQAATLEAAPRAVAAQTTQDVGRIDDTHDVQTTYTISNDGDSDLMLVDVVASCGCTVADYDRVIPPGEAGRVVVTLKPQGYSGPLARSIRVYTNDASNPYIELVVKAVIAPSVYMTPGYARLVGLAGEEIEPARQLLWAPGEDDFQVLSATSELPFVELEVREARAEERNTEATGNQWVVEARLAGEAPDRIFQDTVSVRTNHPRRPQVDLPLFGQIHAPVRSVPASLELGVHPQGSEIEASVRLAKLDENLEVEYGQATLAEGASGRITPSYELEDDVTYLVVVFSDWPSGEIDTEIHVPTSHPEVPEIVIPVRGRIGTGE